MWKRQAQLFINYIYGKTEHPAFKMTVLFKSSNFQATHTNKTQNICQEITSCVTKRYRPMYNVIILHKNSKRATPSLTATDASVTIPTARTENVDTNYAWTTHLQSYLTYILTENYYGTVKSYKSDAKSTGQKIKLGELKGK
jgi:hypothetical protein